MAFKIGGTSVITNSAKMDWNKLSNIPATATRVSPPADTVLTRNARVYHNSGTGTFYTDTEAGMEFQGTTAYREHIDRVYYNCNCNCNCDCRC